MQERLTIGSLFDGSGGFPLAGAINGITPVWSSEIEAYPLRVTAARFPNVQQLGSVLDINGGEICPAHIITFGSPCQDLSVAGKQKGIHDGERSCLFFEAVRIAKEMRNRDRTAGRTGVDIRPRYLVWENVPGAFSSNGGEDFRAVLEAIGGIAKDGLSIPRPPKGKWNHAGCVVGDGWSIAWRVYDAQYWGVPQRRKRIYLVADLASERAGEILFERESLCGDPAEGGEARQGTADDAQGGVGGGGCAVYSIDAISSNSMKSSNPHSGFHETNHVKCLDTAGGNPSCNQGGNVVVHAFMGGQGAKAGSIAYTEEHAPALRSAPSGTNTVPDVVYALQGNGIDRALTAGCNGAGWRENESYTLNTIDRHGVAFAAGFSDALGENAQGGMGYTEEGMPTLRAGDVRSVVYDCRGNGDGENVPTLTGDHQRRVSDYSAVTVYDTTQITSPMNYSNPRPGDPCHPLAAQQHPPLCVGNTNRKYIVRRLTPLECCRLQGFPDWWEDGVEGSDSARYKMWGNGIALPCAVDVLRRIAKEVEG